MSDKVVRLRTSRDKRLDDLALRVGEVLEGETPTDCIVVCAAVIAFLLRDFPSSPAVRERKIVETFKFIRKLAETKP